jgi:hypothetical protein
MTVGWKRNVAEGREGDNGMSGEREPENQDEERRDERDSFSLFFIAYLRKYMNVLT